MTPDHLHAAVSLAGLRAGKHVITHKPLANVMSEARLVIQLREQPLGADLLDDALQLVAPADRDEQTCLWRALPS